MLNKKSLKKKDNHRYRGKYLKRRHKKVVLNYNRNFFKNNCSYHMNFMAGTFQE